MLSLLCPKVIVNIAIPVLMAASTLAQCLGMLNTFFWHNAQLALVIATVTSWLAQPTKLLHVMVKRPLGCDTRDQLSLFLSVFTEKPAWYKDTHLCLLTLNTFLLFFFFLFSVCRSSFIPSVVVKNKLTT